MSKLVTEHGKSLLLKKQEELLAKMRTLLSQKGDAYENGGNGWHDNFAFEQLTRDEEMLGGELAKLHTTIRELVLISGVPANNDSVSVGTIVDLEDEGGLIRTFRVVGFGETNLNSIPKEVEYLAPTIFPFFGARVGEEATVSIGGKSTKLTLINIRS